MSETVETLQKARALVAEGWVQHYETKVVDGKRCFCADGALLAAAGGDVEDKFVILAGDYQQIDAYAGATEALRAVVPPGTGSYVKFNDAEGRTQEEVLALFDKAIELAKENA